MQSLRIFKKIDNVYSDLNISELKLLNKKIIIFDLDNTLVDSDFGIAHQKTNDFLQKVSNLGFIIIIASNNYKSRIKLFEESCTVPHITYIHFAIKPLPIMLWRVMYMFKAKKEEMVLIGDQVFTDVLSSRFAKVDAILTRPLNKKENKQKKIIRFLENKLINDR